MLKGLAKQYPQQAYTVLTRSLIPRWRFVMRTTDVPPETYDRLEEALQEHFFAAGLGWKADDPLLRKRCALPTRLSGLAIPIPRVMAKQEQEASVAMRWRARFATCCPRW